LLGDLRNHLGNGLAVLRFGMEKVRDQHRHAKYENGFRGFFLSLKVDRCWLRGTRIDCCWCSRRGSSSVTSDGIVIHGLLHNLEHTQDIPTARNVRADVHQ
jgi:hypothetical protein